MHIENEEDLEPCREENSLDQIVEEKEEDPEDAEEDDEGLAEDVIGMYLKEVQKTTLLTAEEERELGRRVAEGDHSARERMIQSNLRLVIRIAKRYTGRGLDFLDLIEEGNIGLIKAVDRFQVKKGCRFSTYATWWIRQAIERSLVNQSRTIRLPVHIADEVNKVLKIDRELRSQTKRDPKMEEIAEAMGVDAAHVDQLLRVARKTFSIDHPMGDQKDLLLADLLEDTSSVIQSELTENLEEYAKVYEWLQTLSEGERKILNLRYGLGDRETQTLETIGRQYGVTRERIRQIQCQSLEKIRSLMKEEEVGLRPSDGEDPPAEEEQTE